MSHAFTAPTKHPLTTRCTLAARSTAGHPSPALTVGHPASPLPAPLAALTELVRAAGRRSVRGVGPTTDGAGVRFVPASAPFWRGSSFGTRRRSARTSSSLGAAKAEWLSAAQWLVSESEGLVGLAIELREVRGPKRRVGEREGCTDEAAAPEEEGVERSEQLSDVVPVAVAWRERYWAQSRIVNSGGHGERDYLQRRIKGSARTGAGTPGMCSAMAHVKKVGRPGWTERVQPERDAPQETVTVNLVGRGERGNLAPRRNALSVM